jgi:hypothetical protein
MSIKIYLRHHTIAFVHLLHWILLHLLRRPGPGPGPLEKNLSGSDRDRDHWKKIYRDRTGTTGEVTGTRTGTGTAGKKSTGTGPGPGPKNRGPAHL